MSRITRRSFVLTGGSVMAAVVLAACSPAAPSPTTAPSAATSAPAATAASAAPTTASSAAAPTTAAPAGATATATGAATAASAGGTAVATGTAAPGGAVAARPTPSTVAAQMEVVAFYGKGSVEYDNFLWINQEFTKRYDPSLTVNLIEAQPDAVKLRLQNGTPPEIGATAGGYSGFVTAIPSLKANWVTNLKEGMDQASWDTPGKTWWQTISPIVQPLLQVPGYPGVWSFPREVTTLLFFYNTAHFAKAAVQPPTTWAELDAVCGKLKQAGITPITQDGTAAHGYMEWWLSELWSKMVGNEYLRATILGDHSFTEPEFVKGAQMVRDFIDKGYFVSGFEGLDHTGSQVVFYQGQAAIVLVGSWLIGEMRKAIPPDFKQDVFRFPMVEGGKGDPNHLFGTSNILGVSAQSKNPKIAVEWARWFNSVEVNNRRTDDLDYQSAIIDVKPPKTIPNVTTIFSETTKMDIFGNGDLVGATKEGATKYYELTGQLFSKQLSPADFCKQIDDNFKSYFTKNPDVLKELKPFVSGIPKNS